MAKYYVVVESSQLPGRAPWEEYPDQKFYGTGRHEDNELTGV